MLKNDKTCGWINDLPERKIINVIDKDYVCDWVIIGAGYTGLSAARKLGLLYPNIRIILIDAQLAGDGASGRNSGYLVDSTLNDSYGLKKNINSYKKKIEIYKLGILAVKKFIKEYQVDCDWNECGKYFASSQLKDEKKLIRFSNLLSSINLDNKFYFKEDLSKKLGTKFYNIALYTSGGILLHPGKLVRAMIDTLPSNVQLIENSLLVNWKKIDNKIYCNFKNYTIKSNKIIFCTNGFLSSLGIKKKYNFPLTLTASLSRPLNDIEFKSIGEPKEWGVLPVRSMGATIRMTKDRRILIRNTAEIRNPNFMNQKDLKKRAVLHRKGLEKRFPNLSKDLIESTWSGIVSRSSNGSQIFEKIDKNIFVAGSYFGSGIGAGTLFGEQIALMASNNMTDEIKIIQEREKPNLLPPQPLLNLGIRARLFYERIRARSEI